MTEPTLTAGQRAGERATANTALRAIAELVGKLASLVLFAAMARKLGQSGLGVFVFAFAAMQIALVPVDLGLDRYLLRQVARRRESFRELVPNVAAVKLVLCVPVFGLAFAAIWLLGYGETTRDTVYVLAAGLLLDSLSRTVFSVFMAVERSGLLAAVVVVQRCSAAALGLAALALGYGVVAVAGTYTAASGIGLMLAIALMRRAVGAVPTAARRRAWRPLAARSLPFAVSDVFTIILFKVDAVLLSLLATEAAVGRYGAAYRVFESTLFIVYAFSGAFSAMYAYLDQEGALPVRVVFERSVKALSATLIPVAIGMALLAGPLCRALFGADFASAAGPLRLLAPAVVLLGVVTLASSLVMSREPPRRMVSAAAAMATLNILLNLVLIPRYADSGAAAAMLITEAAFVIVALGLARRALHRLRVASTLRGPVAAAVAMAAVMLPLREAPVLAAAAGLIVYAAVLLAVERRLSPEDLRFVGALLERRLLRRSTA